MDGKTDIIYWVFVPVCLQNLSPEISPKIYSWEFIPGVWLQSLSQNYVQRIFSQILSPKFFPGSLTLVTSQGKLRLTFALYSLVQPLLAFKSSSSFFLLIFSLFPSADRNYQCSKSLPSNQVAEIAHIANVTITRGTSKANIIHLVL